MYQISNNIAYIDGNNGKYQGKIDSYPAQYGRNAIDNYKQYINDLRHEPIELLNLDGLATCSFEDFDRQMAELNKALLKMKETKMTPLDFECRYTPASFINKEALMGAAYESMGQRTSIPVKELEDACNKLANEIFEGEEEIPTVSVSCVDVNNDGRINLAEYSATILAQDALSKSPFFDIKNIDGSFTRLGEDTLLTLNMTDNTVEARGIYTKLHAKFGLAKAQKEFLQNENNLI